MRFAQNLLQDHRRPEEVMRNPNTGRVPSPTEMVQSTRNTTVETTWRECNQMVTFPLRSSVENLEKQGLVSADDPIDKFCIRHVLGPFLEYRIQGFRRAMENTKMQTRKSIKPINVANEARANNKLNLINPNLILATEDIARMYLQHGRLKNETEGREPDPLEGHEDLQELRESELNLTEENVARITKNYNAAQGSPEGAAFVDDGLQAIILLCIRLTRNLMRTIPEHAMNEESEDVQQSE
jgi:hypothetical protein